jgi:hypothetical protein
MAAHSSTIPDKIPFRTLKVSGGAMMGFLALAVVGLLAGYFLAPAGEGHARFWLAMHFNWLFWASLSLGMVMFAVALHLTNAHWAWSVKRFALAGVAFLPVAWVFFIVDFWGGYTHYFEHWLHAEHDPVIQAKGAWLTVPGMFIRDFLGLTLLTVMALLFTRNALRPDVYGAKGDAGQTSWYGRLTRGFRGVEEEAAASVARNNKLGVFLALAYALIWGMVGIDQAMTMLPHWFSTMFPVAFFVAAFHAGIAMTAVMVTLHRRRLGLEPYVTARQYHDLGKLVFAFSVFWMYLNWSQYVVIWYGLLPNEQKWFALRFNEPFTQLSQAVPFMIFVLPFLGLLTRPPKKVPGILSVFAVIILVGNWIERFMITVPSVYEPHKMGEGLPFGIPEIALGLGFLGLFMLCYTWFLKTFPVLPSPAALRAQGSGEVQVPAPAAASAH